MELSDLVTAGVTAAGSGVTLHRVLNIFEKYLDDRKNRGKEDRRSHSDVPDRVPGFQSNASVIASNERIVKHLHDMAELQKETVDALRVLQLDQRLMSKDIEVLGRGLERLLEAKP